MPGLQPCRYTLQTAVDLPRPGNRSTCRAINVLFCWENNASCASDQVLAMLRKGMADILFVFLLRHKASFVCRWPHPCDMSQHNYSAKGFASTCLAATGCACLILFSSASSISAASVRGVQPSLLSVYTSDTNNFKCLDGSKSLQRSRVNDDYCDCLDGSDEPG